MNDDAKKRYGHLRDIYAGRRPVWCKVVIHHADLTTSPRIMDKEEAEVLQQTTIEAAAAKKFLDVLKWSRYMLKAKRIPWSNGSLWIPFLSLSSLY
jgi:beta-xylosidase